ISEQRILAFQAQLGRPPNQDSSTPPPYHLVLADGTEYPLQPKLSFVDPAVDRGTGTLAVRLEVPNPKRMLRDGQFARVLMDVQQLSDALLLPQRAVLDLQGQTFVWVVDGEGRAQTRDVVMGPRIGSEWLVMKGLAAGDSVIVDGVQRLKPGVAVTVQPLAPAVAPAQGNIEPGKNDVEKGTTGKEAAPRQGAKVP